LLKTLPTIFPHEKYTNNLKNTKSKFKNIRYCKLWKSNKWPRCGL